MGSGPAGGTREPRVSEPTRRRRLGSERGHARLDGRAAWGPSSARITSITCSVECVSLDDFARLADVGEAARKLCTLRAAMRAGGAHCAFSMLGGANRPTQHNVKFE